jgi:hypothetical protein
MYMLVKNHVHSALNLSAISALVGLLSAYIVGFYFNPDSNMVVPWKTNPFFSISSAMHFGKKGITLPLFIASVVGFTFVFYKTLPPPLATLNTFLTAAIFTILGSLMYTENIYGCDCSMAKLDSCCTKDGTKDGKAILKPGECTPNLLRPKFKEKTDLQDPLCCNGPSCTSDKDKAMGKRHSRLSMAIAALAFIFMILNIRGNTPIKIIFAISIPISIFTFWDTGGDKGGAGLKLIFDIVEFLTFPLTIAAVYFSVRSGSAARRRR